MNTKAFPIVTDEVVLEKGMDLRDYIAVRAMQALIDLDFQTAGTATAAYEIADAMLIAREAP